ncbi:MAG: diguanylate cyclase [Candidatus Brocadiaceae bacterium]|nr:diguanylate cyclase [Candidatus Taylorbacteria bacterium]MCR4320923.1 diguanylate cyclase [Candidatus Brocadiaceae bacterium]
MTRFLNPIAIFILTLLLITTKCVYAEEISEAEYQQLKNRLKSEFMQKLKEEIKKELIDELKSEYTIEPKQKQVAEKPKTTVKVNEPKNESKEEPVQKTISIGVAELEYKGEAKALLVHADMAMYEAKKRGGNKVCEYRA